MNDKEKDSEESKNFLTFLDEIRKIVSVEGGNVGLCEHCMESNRLYLTQDDYTGVQGMVDNKVLVTLKCHHGIADQYSDTIPF